MHVGADASEYVPAAQRVHIVAEPEEYEPVAQSEHIIAPSVLVYLPARQLTHVAPVVAAIDVDAVPAVH